MGAECSVDRMQSLAEQQEPAKKETVRNVEVINTIHSFNFKGYKEYLQKMDVFKRRLNEIMKITEVLNDFYLKKE